MANMTDILAVSGSGPISSAAILGIKNRIQKASRIRIVSMSVLDFFGVLASEMSFFLMA